MIDNPSHLAFVVSAPILSSFFAMLNLITIYIFYKRFRLTTLSQIVMVNICACDVFVCLISNSFYVVNLVHPVYAWSTGAIGCKVFKFVTMLTNIAQIYFLCILNADRLRRLIYNTSKQWRKREARLFVSAGWTGATIICLPRLFLFDEEMFVLPAKTNATGVVSYNCKPVGLNSTMYIIITLSTFVLAFAVPAVFILWALARSQIFMWKKRNQIHISTTSNAVTRMNSNLAFTFNLTGVLFMAIWSPFFVMSLLDLSHNLLNQKARVHVNFSLRCTLLILGSAKPLVYFVCMDKFRKGFACCNPRTNTSSTSTRRSNQTVQLHHVYSQPHLCALPL